jgi:hypothetical protein
MGEQRGPFENFVDSPIHCLIKHHSMKTYCGSRGTAPRILNFGTRCRWMVRFKPRPLHPGDKSSCIVDWVGPRAGLDAVVKKKSHHCPLRVLNHGCPARSLVSIYDWCTMAPMWSYTGHCLKCNIRHAHNHKWCDGRRNEHETWILNNTKSMQIMVPQIYFN